MSWPLKEITVSDFRSIRGPITVDLNAPVVLIHGPNGAGKTSLLSAIELGLTGDVASLRRVEPAIGRFLPHQDSENGEGAVKLVGDQRRFRKPADFRITKTAIEGRPLLTPNNIKFFNERCYLGQSALSRLLEIYQHQDTRKSDSPLTRFVKELLGLDQYDALIDGLYTAGNVSRLRTLAPNYTEARQAIPEYQEKIETTASQLRDLNSAIDLTEKRLDASLQLILPRHTGQPFNLALIRQSIATLDLQKPLLEVARQRRDLTAASEQLQHYFSAEKGAGRFQIEESAAKASIAFEAWSHGSGEALTRALTDLGGYVSLTLNDAANPIASRVAAEEAAIRELERVDKLLADDNALAKRASVIALDIQAGLARDRTIDEQMLALASSSDGLVQALTSILPHVHDERCPVCERDFSEVSAIPLKQQLSSRISALTESSGRLQSLARDRAATLSATADAQRQLSALRARLLTQEQKDELKRRRVAVDELKTQLLNLTVAASQGAALAQQHNLAARTLSELNAREQSLVSVRSALDVTSGKLGLAPLTENDLPLDRAQTLKTLLATREEHLLEQQKTRDLALAILSQLEQQKADLVKVKAWETELKTALSRLSKAKRDADEVINAARDLAKQAKETRTAIVRRVFNEDLNAVWRNLFVRLAPDEQFVPAFSVPDNATGPVEAQLETHHRSGGVGGNPRAMLSAGNLNTAALTLFLALHLSVRPQLPCLVIDDPVQSMDELHIAQFAALLRTLTKQKERQVIIAVHERSLFDYLTLELSPAFAGDRLNTIELARALDGNTSYIWNTRTFEPDLAVAA